MWTQRAFSTPVAIRFALTMIAMFAGASAHAQEFAGDYPTRVGFSGYEEHGAYSDIYQSDWSRLNSGPAFVPEHVPDGVYADLDGDPDPEAWNRITLPSLDSTTANETYPLWHRTETEDPDVNLSRDDIPPLEVSWEAETTGYDTSLIYIKNKRDIVIEGLAIRQIGNTDRDDPTKLRTGKHSIFVDGCRSLVIRDVYLAGPISHSHIRVRGCKHIFIENVEIEGLGVEELLSPVGLDNLGAILFDEEKIASSDGLTVHDSIGGGGIFINNGNSKGSTKPSDCAAARAAEQNAEGQEYVPTDYVDRDSYLNYGPCNEDRSNCYVNELEWLVIQNSYIHDYTLNPGETNHDGIGIESPADGIVFNNLIERWWGASQLLDVGHRRSCDSSYANRQFRIERNVLLGHPDESSLVKTTGDGDDENSNALLMANNFYSNVDLYDDHEKSRVYHVNESFYIGGDWGGDKVLHKKYGDGPTFVENQFIRTQGGEKSLTVYKSHHLPYNPGEWDDNLVPRNNLYAADEPDSFNFTWIDRPSTSTEGKYEYEIKINEFDDWQGYGRDPGSLLNSRCDGLIPGSKMCGAEHRGINLSPGRDIAFRVNQDFFGTRRGKRPTAGALEASSWEEIHRPFSRIRSGVAWMLRRGTLIGH